MADEEIPVEWVVQDFLDAADDKRVWAIIEKIMDSVEEPFMEAEALLVVSKMFAVMLLEGGADGRDAEEFKTIGCAMPPSSLNSTKPWPPYPRFIPYNACDAVERPELAPLSKGASLHAPVLYVGPFKGHSCMASHAH